MCTILIEKKISVFLFLKKSKKQSKSRNMKTFQMYALKLMYFNTQTQLFYMS